MLRTYFFEPPLEFLFFSLYYWKFQAKSSTLGNSTKLFKISWKFQGHNPRRLEIPHYFFFVTLRISSSFLINPWKFHMLLCYFLISLEIPYPHPPRLFFFLEYPFYCLQVYQPTPKLNQVWIILTMITKILNIPLYLLNIFPEIPVKTLCLMLQSSNQPTLLVHNSGMLIGDSNWSCYHY